MSNIYIFTNDVYKRGIYQLKILSLRFMPTTTPMSETPFCLDPNLTHCSLKLVVLN